MPWEVVSVAIGAVVVLLAALAALVALAGLWAEGGR